MSKRKRQQAAFINNATYINWYDVLMNIAINRFTYKNLPLDNTGVQSLNVRFLETQLFRRGYVCYLNDENIGDIVLKCTLEGKYDVYGMPTRYHVFSPNGTYQRHCTDKNSVIIFNNYTHTPTTQIVEQYAYKLYEIDRAIDVNVKTQKTPITILCNENQRLTMQNLYMQYDGNEPFIFGDKDMMNLSDIRALNTGAPYVSDRLTILKHQILNEFLSLMGIENSNEDKRERLVSNEVASNYGIVEINRNVYLNARREAVEKINRMFGRNIEVYFNSDVDTLVNRSNISHETGVKIE